MRMESFRKVQYHSNESYKSFAMLPHAIPENAISFSIILNIYMKTIGKDKLN